MRELDSRVTYRLTKLESDEVQCLIAHNFGVQTLSSRTVYSKLVYLDLYSNELESLESLRENFPVTWWMNFSKNYISSLKNVKMPLAIGALKLSDNMIGLEEIIDSFSQTHIMRLSLAPFVKPSTFDSTDKETRARIVNELRHVWVLDDDFVAFSERSRRDMNIGKKGDTIVDVTSKHSHLLLTGDWKVEQANMTTEREAILLGAIQNFPSNPRQCDAYKLEILLVLMPNAA